MVPISFIFAASSRPSPVLVAALAVTATDMGGGSGAPRRRRSRSERANGASEELERIARLWRVPASSSTARALQVLEASTARPICDGGLAHYFLREEHRRARLEESPPLAPPSAILALAALPASHRTVGELEESCPVCLHTGPAADGDSSEVIMLLCGHKFHKKCESSS